MPQDRKYPNRRAAAVQNRTKILATAREVFLRDEQASMAEIARRAEVGMATLYRNFPGRPDLLEAVYAEEVDALCAAAVDAAASLPPGEALTVWLRRLLAFIPGKQLMVSELLYHGDPDGDVIGGSRERALTAARPLLVRAQAAKDVRNDLTIEQIFDITVSVATITGTPSYRQPIFETVLDGLRASSQHSGDAVAPRPHSDPNP